MTPLELKRLGENIKVIVMMETKPLSDEFEQIMLDANQFVQVSNTLRNSLPICVHGHRGVSLNPDFKVKIPDIPTVYDMTKVPPVC